MVDAPYVHDERTESTWRAHGLAGRRLPSVVAVDLAWPVSVQDEIDAAVEAARVLDLCGRRLVGAHPELSDGPDVARELAWQAWRDAQSGRGGAVDVGGLVSLPTSQKRTPRRRAPDPAVRALALRASRDAFEAATDAGRVARLRRSIGFTARVHLVDVEIPSYCAMVTLTYKGSQTEWEPKHVSAYIDHLRKWWNRQGFESRLRYVWVAELQKRGSVHYHVAVFIPSGQTIPKPDQCGWWPHGASEVKAARGAVPYLMKYLSKGTKADAFRLPGGARCHGRGGLGESMRLALRWLGLPGFIKARTDFEGASAWSRVVGGGWSDGNGEIWSSEFQRVMVGGVWCLEKVRDHGRPFVADGVFCFLPGKGVQ